MALFKVTVRTTSSTTGVIEANTKEEILDELAKKVYPQWWATHESTTDEMVSTAISELEEKIE